MRGRGRVCLDCLLETGWYLFAWGCRCVHVCVPGVFPCLLFLGWLLAEVVDVCVLVCRGKGFCFEYLLVMGCIYILFCYVFVKGYGSVSLAGIVLIAF